MMYALDQVFGVSKSLVASYIERPEVDAAFTSALAGTRQIVVFGASKQGKSALLEKHLPEEERTTVHCGPSMDTSDIYRSFLRQNGVEIISGNENEASVGGKLTMAAKFKALLPIFGGAEASSEIEASAGKRLVSKSAPIEFNLGAAQDVGELIQKLPGTSRFFVLENFHYLEDSVQAAFAFDLRTFEEMGVRFIILGVWRERNRLNQYNGDLQDRVTEIPVEPWRTAEFEKVIARGEKALKISITEEMKRKIVSQAHGSIGVVQELLKKVCVFHGIEYTQKVMVEIKNSDYFEKAIAEKVSEYATRHVRALESIAAGARARRDTELTAALYLPYYFVITMIDLRFDEIKDGVHKDTLKDRITDLHHKPENVRESDLSGMLIRLSNLQAKSSIVPPLFGYDRSTRLLKIVDSTLFFFLDNCDSSEIKREIPKPSDLE